jgi:hypothetical protein
MTARKSEVLKPLAYRQPQLPDPKGFEDCIIVYVNHKTATLATTNPNLDLSSHRTPTPNLFVFVGTTLIPLHLYYRGLRPEVKRTAEKCRQGK